ncbi:MAG: NAD(P)/FAD-dependent oxidoreductase [Methylomonas sp.]
MQVDVLIVGQGLAGSLLAWELMQHQYRVFVVDDGAENASQVAAGLINPVTGQRLVKSQDVDSLLPAAIAYFRQLGEVFRQNFFIPMPMLRILQSEREKAAAQKRLCQAEYRNYLQSWLPDAEGVETAFGILQQRQTGYLRTRLLLTQLQDFFIAHAAYRQAKINYRDIVLHPDLQWQDIRPRHIVFCEGHRATANPWFRNLPFQPAKGEILGCEAGSALPAQILNYGHWMIPLDGGRFKTGATFDNHNLDNLPSRQAETILLTALQKVCPMLQSARVYEHKTGIRPTTLDKQPFIGAHPRHTNLHIFNGFGAKGSLAIPWHCRQFAAALKRQSPLSTDSHIRRYYDSHFLA